MSDHLRVFRLMISERISVSKTTRRIRARGCERRRLCVLVGNSHYLVHEGAILGVENSPISPLRGSSMLNLFGRRNMLQAGCNEPEDGLVMTYVQLLGESFDACSRSWGSCSKLMSSLPHLNYGLLESATLRIVDRFMLTDNQPEGRTARPLTVPSEPRR